ncbi:MAG: ATP-binding protein [Nitrososphaerota archaeon]|jgi:predicted AAA+ superfamily ATPase|nr:ATP-binding protein [Nitrososphaerota archaeon]MDG7039358.1 ATP-binding protein [Nitrososphaerota archaeon]MDG7043043.1 ATP-binding protein [Nitrososphaerota archaeon]
MVNDELKEELIIFNSKPLPDLITRDVSIPDTKDIVAITGPRRAGKTYFMFQTIKEFLGQGIKRENLLYVNFDNVIFRKYTMRDIIKKHIEIYNPDGSIYLFIDEVHGLRDYQAWLRTLHDEGYRIFITGSSSELLLKNISRELRGRYVSRTVLPFTFKEFLRAKGVIPDGTYTSAGKIMAYISEYLQYGGYPEVIFLKSEYDKIEKLTTILETTFYRDLVEMHGIRENEIAKQMLYHILSNASNKISITGIHNVFRTMGINASKRTLWKYYNMMRDSFLFLDVELYTLSRKKMLFSPKKVYSLDLGIPNVITKMGIGNLMENAVFLQLYRKHGDKIHYYMTGKGFEVDFVAGDRGNGRLIEVSYKSDPDHLDRLVGASNELGIDDLTLVTWEEIGTIKKSGKEIHLVPLAEFLQ